ncbi:DUF952 domain-containing protein [Billgrantia bachuensis]|uniref:DUF952 domain-containing protein n=1 Tax=Billgrantia bachuensis TaxID=2717286 RepID=A0ABX0PZE5_9GAMM|nr:DUF952 domain-containing protein [Halomonas bachuensis]NIC08071.1 DUF952 domain-containing protein [Halomonas bachuensis]
MKILFRVLTAATWREAQSAGVVPRCGNDKKDDGVNLNVPEAVHYTANKYFTVDEEPVLLEVDTSSFAEQIEWREPLANEPWQRPLARIEGLPTDSVISVAPIAEDILNK